MSDWLVAKGKEETLKLAYKYIVEEVCEWFLDLRRANVESLYSHKKYENEYDLESTEFVLSVPDKSYRSVLVELTKDRINVTTAKNGYPTNKRIEICSFGYYGGYVTSYGGYVTSNIQCKNIFVYNEEEDRYEVEKDNNDDTEFFSNYQLYQLWKRLDNIFVSDEWIQNFEVVQ